MKRFEFTLQKVLDFKNQTLDLLMTELGDMRHRLMKIEEKIDQLERYFTKLGAELREKYAEGVSVSEVASIRIFQDSLNGQIRTLLKKKLDLLRLIALKQQQILEAKSSVSGLEKLKDKQLAEYNRKVLKSEEAFVDELVSHAAV